MKRVMITIAISVAVIAAIFALIALLDNQSISVPQEYLNAKNEAAAASVKLSALVSESLKNLAQIEEFDRQKNTQAALDLIELENERKQQKLTASVELASSLEAMARISEVITPKEAGRLAVENISTGVTMVSRVVSYNNYLEQLFEALKYKLRTGKLAPGVSVKKLLKSINEEAQAINTLSDRFTTLEKQFDETYIK